MKEASITHRKTRYFPLFLLLTACAALLYCLAIVSLPHWLDNRCIEVNGQKQRQKKDWNKPETLQTAIILWCTWYICLWLWYWKMQLCFICCCCCFLHSVDFYKKCVLNVSAFSFSVYIHLIWACMYWEHSQELKRLIKVNTLGWKQKTNSFQFGLVSMYTFKMNKDVGLSK